MSNFKSKEEYLTFISAWKSATNSEEAKSKKVTCDYYEHRWDSSVTDKERENYEAKGFTVSENGRTIKKKDGSHTKERGWMNASHFLFYNMMKGRNPTNGFSPITAKRKIPQYGSPWQGFDSAAWDLHFIVQDANQHMDQIGNGKTPTSGNRSRMFLTPFNGGVSISDLAKVDLGELELARKHHR